MSARTTTLGMMKASLAVVIAALESAAIALAVFALLGVTGFALWWFTFDLAAEPQTVFAAVASVWLLGHFVPLSFTLSPELMTWLGLAPEPLSFLINFVPLGITAITLALALRLGKRSGRRGGQGIAGVGGGIAGFALAAVALSVLAEPFLVTPGWSAAIVPTITFALAVFVGFLWAAITQPHPWWESLTRMVLRLLERAAPLGAASFPAALREVSRLVCTLGMLLIGAAALAVCVSLVVGYVDFISISQSLQLNGFGAFVLFLLQLAVLPNLVVWALSWLAGTGFSIGTASHYSPFIAETGALPPVPFVGVLPESWGWAAVLAPALLVCVSVCVGALNAGLASSKRFSGLAMTLNAVAAAVCIGLFAALLAACAGGAFGPGMFASSGVDVWFFAGILTAECAFGLLLGSWGRRWENLLRQNTVRESVAEAVSEIPVSPAAVTTPHPRDESAESLLSKYAWNARPDGASGSQQQAPPENQPVDKSTNSFSRFTKWRYTGKDS